MKLDKNDWVALVCGTPNPHHNQEMEDYVKKGWVNHVGGFHDSSSWNVSGLNRLSVSELQELYNKHKVVRKSQKEMTREEVLDRQIINKLLPRKARRKRNLTTEELLDNMKTTRRDCNE